MELRSPINMDTTEPKVSQSEANGESNVIVGVISLIAGVALLAVAFVFAFSMEAGGELQTPRLTPKSLRNFFGASRNFPGHQGDSCE